MFSFAPIVSSRKVSLIAIPQCNVEAGFSKSGMSKTPHSLHKNSSLKFRIMTAKNTFQIEELAGASLQCQTNPPRRIFVVDHDPYIRHLSAEVLIQHGYEVNAAEDGAAAWEELQVNNYNLLITDQKIPKVSGVELLKKIHATRMALPVIMATKTLPTRKFTLLPWLQSATILRKPYTFEKLLGMVKNVLYATAIVRGEITPSPNWRNQPPAVGFRL
jgi:CheY-like chemotaxis protein